MSTTDHSILWRRLDQPGHEFARLIHRDIHWELTGTAVFAHDQRPGCLNYQVICDAMWQTVSGKVEGWVDGRVINIEISVEAQRRWRLNGQECSEVSGCIDLDLNFSPSTNLLPIRRVKLEVGQREKVRAAWLRFPSFTLEQLEQYYTRLDETTYRYESAGGSFVRDLKVSECGFVIEYPDLWQAETV